MDWACEVPLYQNQNTLVFNHSRIYADTLPKNMAAYYSWIQGISALKLTEQEE